MKETKKLIGKKQIDIEYLLRKEGLNQKEFAKRIHVTQQAVSNWIHNKNGMDASIKKQIEQMFDTKEKKYPEWLITKPFRDYTFQDLDAEIPQLAALVTISEEFEFDIRKHLEWSIWVVIALTILNSGQFEWIDLTIGIIELARIQEYSDFYHTIDGVFLEARQSSYFIPLGPKLESILRRADECNRELQSFYSGPGVDSDGYGIAYTKALYNLNYMLDYYTDFRPYFKKYGARTDKQINGRPPRN